MLQAHITYAHYNQQLSRKIIKQDKKVKFNKKFPDLFKKHSEDVFGYNLYIEYNLPKTASKKKIRNSKDKLWKRYAEESREYLRENLFQNPCIIKSEKCKYLDTSDFITRDLY